MADQLATWVRDVLVWVRDEAGDVDRAAEALLVRLRGGVTPSEPTDPAPSLLGAVERVLRRLP